MKIFKIQNPISNINKSVQNNHFVQTFVPNNTAKNAVNNKNLTNDTFTHITNPISFKGLQTPEQEKEKENFKNVMKTLTLFSDNAQSSLKNQYSKDGVFAKSVDAISTLWLSPNRSKLVKKDIEIYNKHIEKLNDSIEKGTFKETFEEIFQVKYNQNSIDKFNKANEQLLLSSTTKYIADTINEKLKDDLNIAEKNNGELKNYLLISHINTSPSGSVPYLYEQISKEDVFKNLENTITEIVGGKEVLDHMIESQNVKRDAKPEDKYKAYYNIGKFLIKTSEMTAEKSSNGKSAKELKEDYDKAYKEAFGDKNNIQKRVDDYNRSQQIGASMLKSGIKNPVKLALFGLIGLTNPIATIPMSVALSFGFNMLEKATSEAYTGLSTDSLATLMKNTTQSYVDYALETGMELVLPNLATSNEIINTVLSTVRSTTVSVTTNMVSEYMSTGKWDSSQIAPRALVTVVFGQISTKDELGKNLLSMTKGGVNDALLYDKSENNSVRQFINKLQVELQKEYMKNPEMYSSIKAIAINNPEAFEKMVAELLQEHIDKKAEENNK